MTDEPRCRHGLAEAAPRFWAKVSKSDGCWTWTASRTGHGYGRFGLGGKWFHAHRIAWQLVNGDIPEGKLICHHCDNPPCVNPAHLFVGTYSDNFRDAIAKGRAHPAFPPSSRDWQKRITHCKRGHPFDESNTLRAKDGHRSCKKCQRTYEIAYQRRVRAAARLAKESASCPSSR